MGVGQLVVSRGAVQVVQGCVTLMQRSHVGACHLGDIAKVMLAQPA